MASGPQHRHRNRFGQEITEEEFMTQAKAVTEHNVVNPVSTDASGDVVTNSSGDPVTSTVADNAFLPAASEGNTVTAVLAELASFATENISKLGMQIKVATAVLDQLDLYVKYHADGDYIDLGIGVDWSAAPYPVLASDIANDASIAVGSHYIDIDVSAYYSIQIQAASATSSTVDVYATGIRNG